MHRTREIPTTSGPAHGSHRLGAGRHSLTDYGLAQPADDAFQKTGQVGARLVVDVHQLARQHEAPGRGVDEQAVRLAQVPGPVGRADLLGDQPVPGVLVRRAQQGLGEAHQGQTLAGAQRELLQEAFDHPLFLDAAPGPLDQIDGLVQHGRALAGV